MSYDLKDDKLRFKGYSMASDNWRVCYIESGPKFFWKDVMYCRLYGGGARPPTLAVVDLNARHCQTAEMAEIRLNDEEIQHAGFPICSATKNFLLVSAGKAFMRGVSTRMSR